MYETGIYLALLLWAWHGLMLITLVNSQMQRNLNRIGQRIGWLTLAPKPMDAGDKPGLTGGKIFKFLLIVIFGFPFIFLSWAYIAYIAAVILYGRSKNYGEPVAIKEFRWKMKNVDMTFDQIVKELMKVNDESDENFHQFRENLIRDLEERGISYG
ncbi:MAG TPA: hypothetical protein VN081_07080 [Dongiaceae bacterium]|nr:hypothetical protein [Dongiaceae bacterium]